LILVFGFPFSTYYTQILLQ